METKKVIQKLNQLKDLKDVYKDIYKDCSELKNNQTKELTDKLAKKYKLN